jgi:hypothetical protein
MGVDRIGVADGSIFFFFAVPIALVQYERLGSDFSQFHLIHTL